MQWTDRVYGESSIADPRVLDLIACPTFQRLKGVRQAGPSALAFSFKNVTRFEHSVGVYLLLGRLGALPRERIAGLLHDISHTAFSHAVDFVISSAEQDHHEGLKPLLLERPDVRDALERLGYAPCDFFDDAIYPLLERPIPLLCADRLDYFLRDGMACGVVTPRIVNRVLADVRAVDDLLVLTDVALAREVVELFAEMNREWWASATEGFIYNEFADALREALRIGALQIDDLLSTDDEVLSRLESAGNEVITRKLDEIRRFDPKRVNGYVARVAPKVRWLDPPILIDGKVERLSALDRRRRTVKAGRSAE